VKFVFVSFVRAISRVMIDSFLAMVTRSLCHDADYKSPTDPPSHVMKIRVPGKKDFFFRSIGIAVLCESQLHAGAIGSQGQHGGCLPGLHAADKGRRRSFYR
jgi:hypothetical protein